MMYLNRYFKEKRRINIITETAFVKANLMFKAVQVQAKKDGKGVHRSKPLITVTRILL